MYVSDKHTQFRNSPTGFHPKEAKGSSINHSTFLDPNWITALRFDMRLLPVWVAAMLDSMTDHFCISFVKHVWSMWEGELDRSQVKTMLSSYFIVWFIEFYLKLRWEIKIIWYFNMLSFCMNMLDLLWMHDNRIDCLLCKLVLTVTIKTSLSLFSPTLCFLYLHPLLPVHLFILSHHFQFHFLFFITLHLDYIHGLSLLFKPLFSSLHPFHALYCGLGQRGEPGTGPPPFEQPPRWGLGPQAAARPVYRDICPGHWQHAAQSVPGGLVCSRLLSPSGATATLCDYLPPGGSWGRKDTGRSLWQELAPAP